MEWRKRRLVREGDNRGKGEEEKKKGGGHTCIPEVMILVSTVHFNKLLCTPSVRVCEALSLEKQSSDIDFRNSILCTPNKNVYSS